VALFVKDLLIEMDCTIASRPSEYDMTLDNVFAVPCNANNSRGLSSILEI
jgi:hypothetical protein